MLLCSLPRTNPGNQHQYKRVNGPYTLIMTAVGQIGLPLRESLPSVAGLGFAPKPCGPNPANWLAREYQRNEESG